MSAPAILAAVPLLAGVVAGVLAAPPLPVLLAVLTLAWLSAFACIACRWTRCFLTSCVWGCVAAGAILGARAERDTSPPILEWFRASPSSRDPVRLTGVLREDAAITPFGVTARVDATALTENGHQREIQGGVRASIAGSLALSAAGGWRQGRTVTIDALLREPTDFRNIGVPGDRERLARQGIALFAAVKSAALVAVVSRGSPAAEAAGALRAHVRAATAAAVGRWSTKSAGVVTAILIGDRSGLDPDDERRLQEAGTYHVIAISGGNIALLTALLVALGRAVRLSSRRASAVSIVLLAFYGYAAGLAPSVMRATLAGLVYLTARVLDHRGSAMNALGVAATVAAAGTPLSVLDPGFILSFGATLAIVVCAGRLAARAPRRHDDDRIRGLWRTVLFAAGALGAATLCAEIALAPVGARLFGRISVAGLILNFIAIPVMSVIQVAGLTAVVAHAASGPAAAACGWVAHIGTVVLLRSAALVDEAPWLVIDVPPPSFWTIGLWYGAWGVLLLCWHRVWVRVAGTTVVAVVAVLFVWNPPAARAEAVTPAPAGWTRVAFVDVGQGDATIVAPANGAPFLVDAGGMPGSSFDLGRRVTVPALWALGVTRLETLVLTHGDPDHIGGAGAVLRAFAPREVWEGIPVPRNPALQQLRGTAARRGIAWRMVRAGEARELGGIQVRVLNPPDPDWERQKVRNDDSIVLEVRVGDVVFVLPGDISQTVEHAILPQLDESSDPSRVVILKAPHHGSAGSSSPGFIAVTRPAAVIFSAGRRNPFGHPAPVVVDRYRASGARIFRTDDDGEVIVDTDGRHVVIWTWSGRKEVF